MDGSSYRTSSTQYEYSIYAKLLVNGTSESAAFNVIAAVYSGDPTRTDTTKLTVSGDFIAQEVGSIN
jgi:hypothetical protein